MPAANALWTAPVLGQTIKHEIWSPVVKFLFAISNRNNTIEERWHPAVILAICCYGIAMVECIIG